MEFAVERVRDFCGAGIALTSAWNLAQAAVPFVNKPVDMGVAIVGATLGVGMLSHGVAQITNSLKR